jgi:hypothetical protein
MVNGGEHYRPGLLTPQEVAKLNSAREELIKKELLLPVKSNTESKDLIISEETIGRLKDLLGMKSGESGPLAEKPYSRAYKITEDYLRYFSKDDDIKGTKSMLKEVKNWVDGTFKKSYSDEYNYHKAYQDAATIGFFLVVESFRLQYGQEFIENLRRVMPPDVFETFRVVGPSVKSDLTLFEKAEGKIEISEEQAPLSQFIEEFVRFDSRDCGQQVKLGAILGFGAINRLLPKFKPGKSNPQK